MILAVTPIKVEDYQRMLAVTPMKVEVNQRMLLLTPTKVHMFGHRFLHTYV